LIIHGYAVKTLESKETGASKKATVTHNSVFAAHRLQCRMTIRKIDIRHFALPTTADYADVTDWGAHAPGVPAMAPSPSRTLERVGLTGLEPVTLRLSSACSNQLSYRPPKIADFGSPTTKRNRLHSVNLKSLICNLKLLWRQGDSNP
jgi:hypothetical protein